MKFTLDEIRQATGAEVFYCHSEVGSCDDKIPTSAPLTPPFNKGGNISYEISTDTRTIKNGDLYLPLKGAAFDGEDFCDKAIENGAVGCFYTKEETKQSANQVVKKDIIWIKVENTLAAYLQLANFARKKYNPIVIGVTGSSGKTTTKEMIYSVMSEKFKTQKTFSNHNNEIGFCQTVFGMQEDCEVLIVEMGMRGLGEIELITKYAEPDYAVITNAGSAHIGRLGSLDNIAKAKCEITKYLNKALIAHDNERIKKFANFDGEKVFYSLKDVEILEKAKGYSKFIYKGNEYELNIEGDYNIENSLSAIEIGLHLGMTYEEIKSGLSKYKPIEKRWEAEVVNGYNIINDSYNANPESMKASVSTFMELYPNSVVILGNMGELGENEAEFHKEVGRVLGKKYIAKQVNAAKQLGSYAAKNLFVQQMHDDRRTKNDTNLSTLQLFNPSTIKFITVGDLAFYIGEELEKKGFEVKHFDNNPETSRYILDNVDVGTTIFLKASRSMKFEEIIENLKSVKKIDAEG